MLEIIPEYAPDLEWMLQSGQVPREVLLEALLEEQYASVYHLALSILDDHAAAQSAADQTFARALLDQHRYRSQDGVAIWLFRIALVACRSYQKRLQVRRSMKAVLPRWSKPRDFGDSCPETVQDAELWLAIDGLEDHARQIVLLHTANGWQPDRIAALFSVADSEVQAVLASTRQLLSTPSEPGSSAPAEISLPPDQLDSCLVQSLERRWPVRQFSSAEWEARAALILRRLRWLGFRQTKALAALELGLLVLIILLAFAVVWGVNLQSSSSITPLPSAPPPTFLVTKLVYQYVTSTPVVVRSDLQTSTPIQIAQSDYIEIIQGETLQDVAGRLGVTVADLRYWNRLPEYVAVQEGERLIKPPNVRYQPSFAATPVSQVESLPTLVTPVATIQQLVDLLNQSKQTLKSSWLDASIVDYGPHSYIGPARLTHVQAWSSENQALVLIGNYGALPDEVLLMPAGGTGQFVAKPATDPLWFSEWRKLEDMNSPAMQSITQFGEALFNLSSFDQLSSLLVLGREDFAGHSTLKIDLLDPTRNHLARLWVDDSLGQIMRRINYRAGDLPSMEYRINTLDPNVDFPQDLFDLQLPWRGGFAQDFRGAPLAPNAPWPDISPVREMLIYQPTPEDFDLSHSQLIFQYAGSYSEFSPESQYWVFGNTSFLGQTYFGDPWSLICDRSPDGMWIAYVSHPEHDQNQDSMLHWFDLRDPAVRFYTLPDQTGVTELAFSPDNRQLAFFSRPVPGVLGNLSIVDLPNQNVKKTYSTGDIKSLVWSPDGKYLAFIDRQVPSAYQENALVVSVASGQVVFNAPLDLLNGSTQDWPMTGWGVDFPVEMGGMDDCAAPPQP